MKPVNIVEIQSHSNPDKVYRVDIANGRCSCPGWIHKSAKGKLATKGQFAGRPICKHLVEAGWSEGHARLLQLYERRSPEQQEDAKRFVCHLEVNGVPREYRFRTREDAEAYLQDVRAHFNVANTSILYCVPDNPVAAVRERSRPKRAIEL